MKKIFYTIIVSMVIFNFSCKPKLDVSPDIGSLPTGDFAITDTDDYNKTFSVTNTTGFLVNWDFGNGETAIGETVTSYFPFKNDYTITCTFTGKGGSKTITKSISIAVTDPAVSQLPVIKELTNGGVGRTWVYATDYPGTYQENWITWPAYCFMTDFEDEDWASAWEKPWWNPYDGSSTPGVNNEMKFDLDGARNFTFYSSAGAAGEIGSFLVSTTPDITLTIVGSHIPDYAEDNCDPDVTATGVYKIKYISDDELILWQDQTVANPDDFDYGWCWVFKRKGYTYP